MVISFVNAQLATEEEIRIIFAHIEQLGQFHAETLTGFNRVWERWPYLNGVGTLLFDRLQLLCKEYVILVFGVCVCVCVCDERGEIVRVSVSDVLSDGRI